MDKVKELKAQVYDYLAQIEFCQGKIREINTEIAEEIKKSQSSDVSTTE